MASCFAFLGVFGTDAVVFEMVGAAGWCKDAGVPELDGLDRVIVGWEGVEGALGSEEHDWVVAVEVWVCIVVA